LRGRKENWDRGKKRKGNWERGKKKRIKLEGEMEIQRKGKLEEERKTERES
jgi:hypothetical protein